MRVKHVKHNAGASKPDWPNLRTCGPQNQALANSSSSQIKNSELPPRPHPSNSKLHSLACETRKFSTQFFLLKRRSDHATQARRPDALPLHHRAGCVSSAHSNKNKTNNNGSSNNTNKNNTERTVLQRKIGFSSSNKPCGPQPAAATQCAAGI